MNKLLIILTLVLFSCKTRKSVNCDAYGYIQKDTIMLTTEHINMGLFCSSDTTMISYITDTLYIPKCK